MRNALRDHLVIEYRSSLLLFTLTEMADQGNDAKDDHNGHDTGHPQSRYNDFFHRLLRVRLLLADLTAIPAINQISNDPAYGKNREH